ncbi:hypothetical protein A4X09_0g4560 [Tilletia walkeri]|uniref:RNA polymerase II assembly factor Rtp1 C-terminal domain-containing protein n=1 Tax=Tilletia walkeri TaxID=117179 RepID=A0A8X7T4X1_9BASI|nr:hypothetical protein A4X09_0g4560 [Tilletia walkeri]
MAETERVDDVVAAIQILIGENDVKLERSKSDSSSPQDLLEQRLRQRLQRARTVCTRLQDQEGDGGDETALNGASPQDVTGAAALRLLVCMHQSEMEKATSSASIPSKPSLDPALAQPLRKLISLVSRWCFAPAISHFDSIHALAHPSAIDQAQSRFTEVIDDARPQNGTDEEEKVAVHRLSAILTSLRTILSEAQSDQAPSGPPQRLSISTQTARILLELCSSEILDVALRLTRASSLTGSQDAQSASRFVNLVLRSLSTQSALSTLAGVGRSRAIFESKSELSQSKSHSDRHRAPTPAFVLRLVKQMSALQLLRPDGVEALVRSSLDEAESQSELARKTGSYQNMVALSVVMTEPPIGVPAKVFVNTILGQMMDHLQANVASTGSSSISPQLTVVVLALARLSRKHPSHLRQSLDERIYRCFHGPANDASRLVEEDVVVTSPQVRLAVRLLVCIVEHAEPSSDFLQFLLAPILGSCFALSDHLSRSITMVDSGKGKVRVIGDVRNDALAIRQDLRSMIQTCLVAWARLSPVDELAEQLGPNPQSLLDRVARGQLFSDGIALPDPPADLPLTWANDDGGVCLKVGRRHSGALQAVLENLPAALAASISLSDVADIKLPSGLAFSLPVQAATIVTLLKKAQRTDVAKILLQNVLDRYVAVRSGSGLDHVHSNGGDEAEPDMRPILYLQMIMQLFETFGEDLLKGDTKNILAFIDFTLPNAANTGRTAPDRPTASQDNGSQGLQSLLNVSQSTSNEAAQEAEMDSMGDEYEPDAVVTALNLLLATLEGDTRLSTERIPLLGVIQAKIAALLSSSNEEIRRLSQEAMLVLKARAASGSSSQSAMDGPDAKVVTPRSKALAKYQEALKLLQDPILPVRAHGLIILRELVSESEVKVAPGISKKPSLIIDPEDVAKDEGHQEEVQPELDAALLPAIMDIFVQAIQDEESYLYLNAVQGLAAMAISGGSQILKVLVRKYTGADERAGRKINQAEVDRRLRIGEALLRVIQRCGPRLGPNVSIVVEPLVTMLRSANEPTALRSSAISLLGTCVEAAPLEMASGRYLDSLASTCLDIVSIETTERSKPSSAIKRNQAKSRARSGFSVVATGSLADIADGEGSDDEDEQPQPDNALATDTKLPQLRRSALFLISLLISGTNAVLEKHMDDLTEAVQSDLLGAGTKDRGGISALRLPGGAMLQPLPTASDGMTKQRNRTLPPLLFEPKLLERTKTVLGFVAGRDADAVVRAQAEEARRECSELELQLVRLLASSAS